MGFNGVYITRTSFHDVKVASQNKAVKTETALNLRNPTGGRKKSQEKQSRKKKVTEPSSGINAEILQVPRTKTENMKQRYVPCADSSG